MLPTRAPRLFSTQTTICRQCLRSVSTTAAAQSGHNKWSKIRHKKGAADQQKVVMRTQHSKLIAMYTKLYGATNNPQLAHAVTAAKKAGVPKSTIEGAIARGQGRSLSGSSLESITLEAIMPPGIALVVEAETDNRARTLDDLKLMVKKHLGRSGAGAMAFFTRTGRVVFDSAAAATNTSADSDSASTAATTNTPRITVDDVMDEAIEAGAEDIETDPDGNIVVWTQPNMTSAVTRALGPRFADKVLGSDIIWNANQDTRVRVDEGLEADTLADLLPALQEHPEVQAVYANVARGSVSEETWSRIEESIDS